MSFFVLPEAALAAIHTPSSGEKSKVQSADTGEFDQILEENCSGKNCFPDVVSALGGSEATLANYRLTCPSTGTNPEPKPVSSCQSNNCSLSSSACSQPSISLDGRLEQIRQGIENFLSELQSFNFSLDWGEKGKVELVGQAGENGEFGFQLSGNKEAIADLLARALEYLLSWEEARVSAVTSTNPCSLGGNGCPLPVGETQAFVSSAGGTEAESLFSEVTPEGLSPFLEGEEATSTGAILAEAAPTETANLSSTLTGASLEESQLAGTATEATLSVLAGEEGGLSFSSGKGSQPEFSSGEMGEKTSGGENLLFSNTKIATDAGREKGEFEPVVGESPSVLSKNEAELVFSLEASADNSNRLDKVQALFDRIFELATREEGPKKLVIKLEPESLGSIVVQVMEDGKRVQCFWQVADPKTQELIEQNLPLLEARLGNEGMSFQNFLGEERGYWNGEQAEFLSSAGSGGFAPYLGDADLGETTPSFNWALHPGQVNLLI
ncbi:MAG: Flagellar hook-length control protein FliK [Candidatus Atribacteria bacterium]|nr:Flagellar hook-length control protein FliK [Candidatus Atribacteria bacterium]